MNDPEADKAAILMALRAETDAWLRRDFDAMARHWVHAPGTRKMTSHPSSGHVVEGWEAIAAEIKSMINTPRRGYTSRRLSWDRVNIVMGADMAWVSYDQIGTDTGDAFELAGVQHELKIFTASMATGRLAASSIMQGTVERAGCPLIEVDAEARILWMNREAWDRWAITRALLLQPVACGRAGATAMPPSVRRSARVFEGLREPAARWFAGEARPAAVPLGEGDGGAPIFCWVLAEDGKVLVSFDDAEWSLAGSRLRRGLWPVARPAAARPARR